MIDLNETFLSVKEAVAFLPGVEDETTIWRWRSKGIRGIKLESWLIGGHRYTSKEAIERFLNRVNAEADGKPYRERTGKQRQRAIESAEKEVVALIG